MTDIDQSPTMPMGLNTHPTVSLVLRLIKSIAGELRCRRGVRDLRRLDDHMLADIGLVRTEIEYAARGGRSKPTVR